MKYLFLIVFLYGQYAHLHAIKKPYVIVLDPGHGGIYTGTVGKIPGAIEKDLVLAVAKRLKNRLQKKGYDVYLTRESDTALDRINLISDLSKRALFSDEKKAELFVSLHVNGCSNKNMQGFELYVPYEAKYPLRSYRLASALHYDLSHKIKPDFSSGTLGNLNILDKGIRASRFNVLMKVNSPAVLVELGYLSHVPSARQLCDSGYQELLADALYCGIRRYMIHEYGVNVCV